MIVRLFSLSVNGQPPSTGGNVTHLLPCWVCVLCRWHGNGWSHSVCLDSRVMLGVVAVFLSSLQIVWTCCKNTLFSSLFVWINYIYYVVFRSCICNGMFLSTCVSLSVCLHVCLCLSVCLSTCVSVCLYVCLSVYMCVCVSVCRTYLDCDCKRWRSHSLVLVAALPLFFFVWIMSIMSVFIHSG